MVNAGDWVTGQSTDSITWTLVVYPESGAVPAVSGVGLGAMVVVILAVGGILFNRIKRQVA